MTDTPITPQEPGAIPGVEHDKLAAIADATVGDLAEALADLTSTELDQLLAIEAANKNRKSALQAIEAELEARAANESAPVELPASGKTPLGDDVSYANRPASEIDASKLSRPVLTSDGWLLPAPNAQAEG